MRSEKSIQSNDTRNVGTSEFLPSQQTALSCAGILPLFVFLVVVVIGAYVYRLLYMYIRESFQVIKAVLKV